MLIQIVDSYSHKNRDKPMNIPLQQAMSSTLLQEIEEVEQANEQELMMHRMSERVRHDTEQGIEEAKEEDKEQQLVTVSMLDDVVSNE